MLLLVAACHSKNDSAIEQLLRTNVQCAQSEDRAGYMATIAPDSPIRGVTEKMLVQVFEMYDLRYDIESIEVLSNDGSKAAVRVVQTTRKLSGPAFRDNRVRMTSELHKIDGDWRLYNSKVEKIDYLN